MNPFEFPPSTPAVSFEPPSPAEPRRRRGRMAAVALASAGLVGGGLVAVGHFASADEPRLATPALVTDASTGDETSTDESSGDGTGGDETGGDDTVTKDGDGEITGLDGTIVIDLGSGDPITIDLGELAGSLDDGDLDRLGECVPWFDLDVDLEPLDVGEFEPVDWGGFPIGGDHVTVFGPDGMTVIDFGEGDGSVTIERKDGELSVSSQGDVTVSEPGDLLGSLPIFETGPEGAPVPPFGDVFDLFEEGAMPDPGELEACLAEFGIEP